MIRPHTIGVLVFALLSVACGRDTTPRDSAAGAASATPADTYRQQQQAFADSVLRSVLPADRIATAIKYKVAPQVLVDAVGQLSLDSTVNCLARGREKDPYLKGVVNFWVNMSVVGTDHIGVYKSTWTSGAGAIVDDCLNTVARAWHLPSSLAAPAPYIAQVTFK